MRIEYVIVAIIVMIVILLALVTFLSGVVPGVREALHNIACGLGLGEC